MEEGQVYIPESKATGNACVAFAIGLVIGVAIMSIPYFAG